MFGSSEKRPAESPLYTPAPSAPVDALTMDRLSESSDVIVAQSTSQFFRCLCFQPSINWILSEQDNFDPGTNPFDMEYVSGWIHEESSCVNRCFSHMLPGWRRTVYFQHAGPPPDELVRTERSACADCCRVQFDHVSRGMDEEDRRRDLVAVHRKDHTCCVTAGLWLLCCDAPYLETWDAKNRVPLGATRYVCDAYLCVPKFDVFDGRGRHRYRIRPDTCCAGCCVTPRCGGAKGRCLRVPFVVRDPHEHNRPLSTMRPPEKLDMDRSVEPLPVNSKARVDVLWSGWVNECCTRRDAYHLAYPHDATPEDKITLIGSSILLDVTLVEQRGDNS